MSPRDVLHDPGGPGRPGAGDVSALPPAEGAGRTERGKPACGWSAAPTGPQRAPGGGWWPAPRAAVLQSASRPWFSRLRNSSFYTFSPTDREWETPGSQRSIFCGVKGSGSERGWRARVSLCPLARRPAEPHARSDSRKKRDFESCLEVNLFKWPN